MVLLWLALCVLVAYLGRNKKTGCFWTFVVSLIFSPLVGAIVVFCSGEKETLDEIEDEMEVDANSGAETEIESIDVDKNGKIDILTLTA